MSMILPVCAAIPAFLFDHESRLFEILPDGELRYVANPKRLRYFIAGLRSSPSKPVNTRQSATTLEILFILVTPSLRSIGRCSALMRDSGWNIRHEIQIYPTLYSFYSLQKILFSLRQAQFDPND